MGAGASARRQLGIGGAGEGGGAGGTGAVLPYGEVPVELWMLIFGFCRRDAPVQHAPGNNSAAGVEEDACIAAWN
jgi:hypothetical protein